MAYCTSNAPICTVPCFASLREPADYMWRHHADGTARLRCSPEAEFRNYNDVDGACHLTWPHLPSLQLPVTVASGTDEPTALFARVEAASAGIADAIPACRFEK